MPNEQVQYIEFASRDLAVIKKFYESAFGWAFVDYGPEYTAFDGEHVSVGFCPGDPKAGTTMVILYAEDLEVSLEKVKSAGGEISREVFTFPGGRRFEFSDPDGNLMAVWSNHNLGGKPIA